MKAGFALSLSASLLLNVVAFAQSPSAPPADPGDDEVVRITSNLVQIDAVVTDRDGRQVTDLLPGDFEIYENGKLQPITNFSYVSVRPASGQTLPPAAWNVPPPKLDPKQVSRTIVFVVDDLSMSFSSIYYSKAALKRFIDTQMQPGDLVAIVRASAGMGALQQFTNDRRLLAAAVDRIVVRASGSDLIGVFGSAGPDEVDLFRGTYYTVGMLGAVYQMVKKLRELPGRKSVVLISDGFRLNLPDEIDTRTQDALRQLTDFANRSSTVIHTMDARGLAVVGRGAAAGGQRTRNRQPALSGPSGFDASTPGGSTIPDGFFRGDDIADTPALAAVDGNGFRRAPNAGDDFRRLSDEVFETQGGLIDLARTTGGLAIINSNDLTGGLKRIMVDQQGYYLLAYTPSDEAFRPLKNGAPAFRKLKVKVKRKGLTIRTRTGYFGMSDDDILPTPATREARIAEALTSPFNAEGIRVRLTSLFASNEKALQMQQSGIIKSVIQVEPRDLTFIDDNGWKKATIEVVGVVFDDGGQLVGMDRRKHNIRIKPEMFDKEIEKGIRIELFDVPVAKAGAYQSRVAVHDDSSNRVGSGNQFVEVFPLERDQISVSGLILTGVIPEKSASGQVVDLREINHPEASYSIREFQPGQGVAVGCFMYNPVLDATTGQPRLNSQIRIFRDGREVFTGTPRLVRTDGITDFRYVGMGLAIVLPPDFEPGDYALQLVVTDLNQTDAKRKTVSQWIDFTVVPATTVKQP
jgi:VWFA-related protein